MIEGRKRTIYRILMGSAGLLYVWGLGALWFSHEWNIPESTFLFVGILPVVAGVMLMVFAIRMHVELLEDELEDDASDATEAEPDLTPDGAPSGEPSPRS